MSQAQLEYTGGPMRRRTWGRKDEEFVADFLLVSKRTLTPEEHRVFRYHYLLGADYSLCCRQLKMDRGSFFHTIYKIEATLGRTFRELEPFALFPLDEYFHGAKPEDADAIRLKKVVQMERSNRSLSELVPVKRAA